MNYDVVIVGAGPAGIFTALELIKLESDKKIIIIEKGTFGGQITFSPLVENFPTQASLSGAELADKLTEQVLSHGADIEVDTVLEIKDLGECKKIICESTEIDAKTAIIARTEYKT